MKQRGETGKQKGEGRKGMDEGEDRHKVQACERSLEVMRKRGRIEENRGKNEIGKEESAGGRGDWDRQTEK